MSLSERQSNRAVGSKLPKPFSESRAMVLEGRTSRAVPASHDGRVAAAFSPRAGGCAPKPRPPRNSLKSLKSLRGSLKEARQLQPSPLPKPHRRVQSCLCCAQSPARKAAPGQDLPERHDGAPHVHLQARGDAARGFSLRGISANGGGLLRGSRGHAHTDY